VGSPDCHGLDDDRAISMTPQGQMSQHGCGKVKGRKAPPKKGLGTLFRCLRVSRRGSEVDSNSARGLATRW
jgi:hypothetical protein